MSITKLKIISTNIISFTFKTTFGTVDVMVNPNDLDKDGRPKAVAKNYMVLHTDSYNEKNPTYGKIIRLIGNELSDCCDDNGWNLWSY